VYLGNELASFTSPIYKLLNINLQRRRREREKRERESSEKDYIPGKQNIPSYTKYPKKHTTFYVY
jgi:hypothetical protein